MITDLNWNSISFRIPFPHSVGIVHEEIAVGKGSRHSNQLQGVGVDLETCIGPRGDGRHWDRSLSGGRGDRRGRDSQGGWLAVLHIFCVENWMERALKVGE